MREFPIRSLSSQFFQDESGLRQLGRSWRSRQGGSRNPTENVPFAVKYNRFLAIYKTFSCAILVVGLRALTAAQPPVVRGVGRTAAPRSLNADREPLRCLLPSLGVVARSACGTPIECRDACEQRRRRTLSLISETRRRAAVGRLRGHDAAVPACMETGHGKSCAYERTIVCRAHLRC
jgi:hypothetical protein